MEEKPSILDLDVLRPKPEYIRLGNKNIDISFIPSGVAVDIMDLQDKITELTDTPEKMKKLQEDGEVAKKTFDLSAEICAKITSCQFSEMDKTWLLKNTSIGQLKILVNEVTRAVYRSLETAEDEELKKRQAAGTASP